MIALLCLLVITGCAALAPKAKAVSPEFYGIMTGGDYWKTDDGWDGMAATGAKTARIRVDWSTVDPGFNCSTGADSDPDFAVIDEMVLRAANRKMRVLPYIYGNKCAPNTAFPLYGSVQYEPWLDMVGALVRRYGYGGTFWKLHEDDLTPANEKWLPVEAWEVWNEPNLPVNNPGGTAVIPQLYAKLLIDAAEKIREAQFLESPGDISKTKILFGGLIPIGTGVMAPKDYFDSIFSNPYYTGPPTSLSYSYSDLHDSYDALSLHPYRISKPAICPLALTNNEPCATREIHDARAMLDSRTGDIDKPIYVTELGWAVGHGNITEAAQAQYIKDAFRWITNNAVAYKINLATVYFYRDSAGSQWMYHAGLKKEDGTNRESWCRFVEITGAPTCPKKAAAGSSPGVDRISSNGLSSLAYRNVDGGITNWTWGPHSGSVGTNLGGNVASGTSPVVSMNPANGGSFIAYRDTSSRISFHQKSSWSGPWTGSALGSGSPGDVAVGASPRISASPSATFIAYRNTSGGVSLWLWTALSGWVNAPLGGSVAANTNPDIYRDPVSGNTIIPYQDAFNRISYWQWSASGWSNGTLGSGSTGTVSPGSSPAVAVDPAAPHTVIAFRNASGTISTWTWDTGPGWAQNVRGGTPASGITPVVNYNAGSTFIAYRNTANTLAYLHKTPSTSWTPSTLTSSMAAGSNPALEVDPTVPATFIPYNDSGQKIAQWNWGSGSWFHSVPGPVE